MMMLQSLTSVMAFYSLVVCSLLSTTGSGQTYSDDQSYPQQGYEQQYPEMKQIVSYEYAINDYYGNEQSKKETIDGDTAVGEYKTLMPDGRRQTVTYNAGADGYLANVAYDESKATTSYSAPPAAPAQTYSTPVVEYAPAVTPAPVYAPAAYETPEQTYDDVKQIVSYEYAVNDYYGNEQSKKETIDGDTAVGEYKTLMADGRRQTVTYNAGADGYLANVAYDDSKTPSYTTPPASSPTPSEYSPPAAPVYTPAPPQYAPATEAPVPYSPPATYAPAPMPPQYSPAPQYAPTTEAPAPAYAPATAPAYYPAPAPMPQYSPAPASYVQPPPVYATVAPYVFSKSSVQYVKMPATYNQKPKYAQAAAYSPAPPSYAPASPPSYAPSSPPSYAPASPPSYAPSTPPSYAPSAPVAPPTYAAPAPAPYTAPTVYATPYVYSKSSTQYVKVPSSYYPPAAATKPYAPPAVNSYSAVPMMAPSYSPTAPSAYYAQPMMQRTYG